MPALTAGQLAVVSAALPGWIVRTDFWGCHWYGGGEKAALHYYPRPNSGPQVQMSALCHRGPVSDWPAVRVLGDQAAAAATLLEGFAKEARP